MRNLLEARSGNSRARKEGHGRKLSKNAGNDITQHILTIHLPKVAVIKAERFLDLLIVQDKDHLVIENLYKQGGNQRQTHHDWDRWRSLGQVKYLINYESGKIRANVPKQKPRKVNSEDSSAEKPIKIPEAIPEVVQVKRALSSRKVDLDCPLR